MFHRALWEGKSGHQQKLLWERWARIPLQQRLDPRSGLPQSPPGLTVPLTSEGPWERVRWGRRAHMLSRPDV